MGALVGLCFGLGLLVIGLAVFDRRIVPVAPKRSALGRLAEQSGIPRLDGSRLLSACICVGFVCATFVLLTAAIPVAALIAGVVSGFLPVALLRRQARNRQRALRKVWPDAIDGLMSAARAGLSLPESVCELAEKGPALLRPAFAEFAGSYRVSGSFESSIRTLMDELSDPVADRVGAALLVAHQVGGNDLGLVLRSLSALLREDARVRDEIEARQSWTVNAARLAVAAPWITLALLSTRPEALHAYDSPQGAFVLLVAAGISFVAYRVMMQIGRLPTEMRLVQR